MRINTNMSSQFAQRALSGHSKQVESTTGRLSSGTRVRTAADDAANMAIGVKSSSHSRSQGQALRNANDSISELQVAEGSLNEVSAILTRMKELSIQAASDTQDDSTRALLNIDYMQMRREIVRITGGAKFKDQSVFSPPKNTREFMIGTDNHATSKITLDDNDFTLNEFNLGIVDSSVINQDEARENLKYIDKAIDKVSGVRAKIGSYQTRISSSISNLDVARQNELSANSQRMDTDYAHETSELVNGKMKVNAANAILSQANHLGKGALRLLD
ncbi:MAG TPA: flagellin [Bacteriovoracaceae bacterium]|nr:flagellin [Bacteriovoracaceae bacterium]